MATMKRYGINGGNSSANSTARAWCFCCGRWPACDYVDLNEKMGRRVCEDCIKEGRVVRNEQGIYEIVTSPESDAAPEELPA